ncbi:MAG: hypothetical protein Q7S42_01960 [Candidatus Omnitrophota bacterium]|nr:hypothetical protein [Candidatus Omnitrophota bacterium]
MKRMDLDSFENIINSRAQAGGIKVYSHSYDRYRYSPEDSKKTIPVFADVIGMFLPKRFDEFFYYWGK